MRSESCNKCVVFLAVLQSTEWPRTSSQTLICTSMLASSHWYVCSLVPRPLHKHAGLFTVQPRPQATAQACWPLHSVASSPGHCTSMLASSQCSLVPRPLPNLFRRCSNFYPRQNLGTRLVYMYIILLVSFSDFCCTPPAFVVNEHGARSLAGVSGNLQEF